MHSIGIINRGIVHRQRGIALVIVLWMVSLLSVIAASMSYAHRQETRLTGHFVQQAKLQALAEAGVYHGIQLLLEDEQIQLPGDGQQYELSLAEHRISVSLQDERGKIDLNTASAQLLRYILANEDGIDSLALAEAIVDWRDSDDNRMEYGAEDEDYRLQDYAYGSKDGKFLSTLELQQVMGMSPQLYEDTSRLFTIYTGSRGVDPWVASPTLLNRMPGMTDEQVEGFIARRDQMSKSSRSILKSAFPAESQPYIAKSGPAVFTIMSSVQSATGGRFGIQTVVHITRKEDAPFTIIAQQHVNTIPALNQAQVNE